MNSPLYWRLRARLVPRSKSRRICDDYVRQQSLLLVLVSAAQTLSVLDHLAKSGLEAVALALSSLVESPNLTDVFGAIDSDVYLWRYLQADGYTHTRAGYL